MIQAHHRHSSADADAAGHAGTASHQRERMGDANDGLRIEAAAALARHGETDNSLPALIAALHDESREIVLHAARALELLGPAAAPAHTEMQTALAKARTAEQAGDTMAMFVRFSLEAALKSVTP